ncbi:MAG: LysR substrate-binding domain-containing protein [Acidobacteriaceae bacterium]
MDLKIRHLECFLTVAETLHFGKAARLLYMSQPALTFQIQSMESAIGVQLFDRDRRRVELTEAGRNLVSTGNRILSELRRFTNSVASLASEQPLRVVCAPAGEQVILPAVIRRLKEISPNVRVGLWSLSPIEQLQALQENRVDVLLMVRRVEVPGITFKLITKQRIYAVVPEGSRFAQKGSISVRDFASQPIIVAARQYCDKTHELVESLLSPYGVEPNFIEAPVRQSAQEALVAAGVGVALNTEWRLLAPFPGVKMVSFEEPIPPLHLGAAWRTVLESSNLSNFKIALQDVIFDLMSHKKLSQTSVRSRPAMAAAAGHASFPAGK